MLNRVHMTHSRDLFAQNDSAIQTNKQSIIFIFLIQSASPADLV